MNIRMYLGIMFIKGYESIYKIKVIKDIKDINSIR